MAMRNQIREHDDHLSNAEVQALGLPARCPISAELLIWYRCDQGSALGNSALRILAGIK